MAAINSTLFSFKQRVFKQGAPECMRALAMGASLVAMAAPSLMAQSLAGLSALNGTVRDASGAAVADAAVAVANTSLGIERKLKSNGEGYFSVVSLPPASGYEVGVEKSGFSKSIVRNIQLNVGANATVPVPEPGAAVAVGHDQRVESAD
jgi:hypothetical protein